MRIHTAATPAILAAALMFASPADALGGEPRTGTFNDQLTRPSDGRLIIKYKMRAPEKLPEAKTLGLIVFFHGRT